MTRRHHPAVLAVAALVILCAVIVAVAVRHPGPRGANHPSPQVSASTSAEFKAAGQKLQADLSTITILDPSTAILAPECTVLGGDTDQAVALGPYPDPTINSGWSSMLTSLKNAATECVAGIDNNDPQLQQKAMADLKSAQGELETVLTAIGGN